MGSGRYQAICHPPRTAPAEHHPPPHHPAMVRGAPPSRLSSTIPATTTTATYPQSLHHRPHRPNDLTDSARAVRSWRRRENRCNAHLRSAAQDHLHPGPAGPHRHHPRMQPAQQLAQRRSHLATGRRHEIGLRRTARQAKGRLMVGGGGAWRAAQSACLPEFADQVIDGGELCRGVGGRCTVSVDSVGG